MIGTVIGNFKVTSKIGEGGMGAVFKGTDLMLERDVAIKMLRPELASQPDIVERFRSEAVTLAKLNHPHIATLYTFLRHGNDFFMVMEFVQGETLDRMIRRTGAIPVDHAITLFCEALEGIGRAHRLGIIHRDIKPANMMLTEDGSIKVMDFGIARVLGTARMTRQGNIVGTIEYMSPEAIQGLEIDARTDIYSLGILLYEMLTGRLPFTSDSEFGLMMAQIQQAPPPPRTFSPHIPLGVEQAIMRSLAKRPEARFQTAGEFREALTTATSASRSALQQQLTSQPTRIAVSDAPTLVQKPSPKETRLAGASETTPRTDPTAPKETRLASQSGEQAARQYQHQPPPPQQQYQHQYGQPQPAYPQPQPPQRQPAQPQPPQPQRGFQQGYPQAYQSGVQPQPSFFSRLSWIHYAGAALFLLIILAVPAFLILTAKKADLPSPASNPPSTSPQSTNSQPSSRSADPATTTPSSTAPSAPVSPPQVTPPSSTGGIREVDIPTNSTVSDTGKTRPAKPAKKKEEEDLAKRRKEARKLLDQ